jgi:hypothetical protein
MHKNMKEQEISKSATAVVKMNNEDGNLKCFKGSFTCAMIKREFPTIPIRFTANTNPIPYTGKSPMLVVVLAIAAANAEVIVVRGLSRANFNY